MVKRELNLFIGELQWGDNYYDMWNKPENYLGKKMKIYLMIENFDGKKLIKLNKNIREINPIRKATHLFKGQIIGINLYGGNKDALTVVIDCGIPINVRPKNFTHKLGDYVGFKSRLDGQWTNIFSGCIETEIKIINIDKISEEREFFVSSPSHVERLEKILVKNILILAEVDLIGVGVVLPKKPSKING